MPIIADKNNETWGRIADDGSLLVKGRKMVRMIYCCSIDEIDWMNLNLNLVSLRMVQFDTPIIERAQR